jgi:DMSO/TMAO reductase YedYZ molybdopterin-dependent catalytic subunit
MNHNSASPAQFVKGRSRPQHLGIPIVGGGREQEEVALGRTRKWPVLDADGAPTIDVDKWRFEITGLVGAPVSFSWQEFQQLPRVKVFADFHCVTRWSRLGNLWEGVASREILRRAQTLPEAR